MNRLIISLLLILSMSCNSNKEQPLDDMASIDTKQIKHQGLENDNLYSLFTTEFYELKFKLNNVEGDIYNLILDMELKDGSFFVSPNAKRDFTGKFKVIIDDNGKLKKLGNLIETPLSVEEFDLHPFVNGHVNWVRENTTYKLRLQLQSDEDFEVPGIIQFTIEPSCSLEKIPFFIKYSNGAIKIEIDRC